MKKKKDDTSSHLLMNQISFYGEEHDSFIVGLSIIEHENYPFQKHENQVSSNKEEETVIKLRPEKF